MLADSGNMTSTLSGRATNKRQCFILTIFLGQVDQISVR